MARLIDRPRFVALVGEHYGGAFVWGRCDCIEAPSAVWRALGLGDPAAAFRGRYGNARARRRLGRVEDRAAERFAEMGWPEIDPSEAEIGDAGIIGRWLALRLEASWLAKAERGAIEYEPERARRAWRAPL